MQRTAVSGFGNLMPPFAPPQQAAAARLLGMLKCTGPHPDTPTPAGPAHAQQEGLQLTSSLLEVVLTFAHTIDGLSHLPGAHEILNPNIHTAARSFMAMSAASTAQAAQPPRATSQDMNNTNSDIDMQGPQLSSLHIKAPPAGIAAIPQAALSPAGSMPAQQANLSAPGTPVNNYNAFMPFSSLTEANISMGQAPFGVQGPRGKRVCTPSIKARLARASDNTQDILSMPLMARSPSFDAAEVLASLTSSPMASLGNSTFFNQPSTLMAGPPSILTFDALDELAAAAAATAAGVARKTPKAPKHTSGDTDWVAPKKSCRRSIADAFAIQETPAPQAAAPAVKAAPKRPAAKPRTVRKADRKSTAVSSFQREADECAPETKAAVHAMWQADASVPVFCQNKESGVRAEGIFKLINGAKKVVVVSGPGLQPGTVMSLADFERAGDRLATKNWQLSVCVTGLHTQIDCTTELKIGHATRILGVH